MIGLGFGAPSSLTLFQYGEDWQVELRRRFRSAKTLPLASLFGLLEAGRQILGGAVGDRGTRLKLGLRVSCFVRGAQSSFQLWNESRILHRDTFLGVVIPWGALEGDHHPPRSLGIPRLPGQGL